MIPSAGQRVGPYEILGRLGSGGMGLVFSAWDSRLQRDVAIKLLRDEYSDGETRERFLREARAASGLNHPNICTVFDLGEQDGDPYLVMELLKGETLRSRILAGPMSAEELVHAATEIADGLAAAHGRGVIHRDIKPANIFLVDKPSGGWQAKVLDFGLAKIEIGGETDEAREVTGFGSTVGTVSYMSPEQARGEPLDARSDLFALGVVMYEMATGRVPFRGATSALVFVRLLGHPPQPVREANPTISAELDAIILKLLAKEREGRFQSAAEVVRALRNVDLKKLAKAEGVARQSNDARGLEVSKGPEATAAVQEVESAEEVSRDEMLLPPVRWETVPPVTLAPSVEHWRSKPASIGGTGAQSGAEVLVEVDAPPPPAPARRNPSFDYVVPGDEAVVTLAPVGLSKAARTMIWVMAAVVGVVIAGVIYSGTRRHVPAIHGQVELMMASIINHSGDKALDGVLIEALRLDLAQSSKIALTSGPGVDAESAGLSTQEVSVEAARQVAAAAGATCFLYGEARQSGGAEVVSVRVYDVGSGEALLTAEEKAASRQQMAEAIDRLSTQIRVGLGEPEDVVARSSVPLARDATSNIEALQAFVAGMAADGNGRNPEAIAALQHAVELQPTFTQAWLRLASIYRKEHAEIAAAEASSHARSVSSGASSRTTTLAAASYELDATADYPRALALLDQLGASYPVDSAVQSERALLLRLQGKFPEAIEAAQAALARNPHDLEASRQAEYAMVALGRVEAAAQLETESAGRRVGDPELRILVGFLSDRSGAGLQVKELEWLNAQVLDATGRMDMGLETWRGAESAAKATPALASAGAYAMSQAALNRAMTGDCGLVGALVGEAAALPRGQSAIFASGMALGLCGDLDGPRTALAALTTQYPQSFPAKSYYLGNLMAVQQLRSGDPNGALTALGGAAAYDLMSLTPYMQGLADSAAAKWPAAISDFQFVLLHRGAAMLTNAPMYAMAQLGLARAYSADGDRANSVAAYKAFAQMWKAADAGDPLLIEARKHSR